MTVIPFGNDPAKIERYRAFWTQSEVNRPIVGFSMIGWFPLDAFPAAQKWKVHRYLNLKCLQSHQ